MTDAYKQVSEIEWEWQSGQKHQGVCIFGSTRTLIWSGWMDTPGGPQFDDGQSQTFEYFLRDGAPYIVPEALLTKLIDAIEKLNEKRSHRHSSWRRALSRRLGRTPKR